jgi:hypothetical protein
MNTTLSIYVALAAAATIYQGYRGFRFQWLLGMKEVKTTLDRVLLLCVADTILFAVCSAAGFAALWLAYDLYTRIPSLADMSASGAVFLLSLGLFGLLGVTGQLPPLIQLGKLLPGVGGAK